MSVEIPDKMYFRIGEVTQLTGIKTHVLRYWESEFKTLSPAKSRSRQRLYRRKDVELVLRLKDLLYLQGFTIAGAKKKLAEESDSHDEPAANLCLKELRQDLLRLRDLVNRRTQAP